MLLLQMFLHVAPCGFAALTWLYAGHMLHAVTHDDVVVVVVISGIINW